MGNKRVLIFPLFIILIVLLTIFIVESNNKEDKTSNYNKEYISVRIHENDTMYSLAEEFCNLDCYEDYNEWFEEVARINDISDINKIRSGERITLPIIIELKDVENGN